MASLAFSVILLFIFGTVTPFPFQFPDHKDRFAKDDYGGYCERDRSCVCVGSIKSVNVHCDGIVDVIMEDKTIYKPSTDASHKFAVEMFCDSENSDSDSYEALMSLNLDTVLGVDIRLAVHNCPLPKKGFSKIFPPTGSNVPQAFRHRIYDLEIVCMHKSEFDIRETDLEGLQHLKKLKIKCKALKSLESNVFRGISPKIEKIYIHLSSLVTIPLGLFKNCTQLKRISLQDSEIDEIPEGSFDGLQSLKDLEFGANRLKTLPDNAFKPIPNLGALDLHRNGFISIPKAIGTLHNLRVLYLSFNDIVTLRTSDLINQTSMESLSLYKNRIRTLCADIFHKMSNLTSIKLDHNEIGSLKWNPDDCIVEGVTTNEYGPKLNTFQDADVDLTSNGTLHSLPEELFSKNTKLTWLSMSYNKLVSLPEELFINNKVLQYVYLSHNELERIPTGIFKSNPNIRELDITGNKIRDIPSGLISHLKNMWKFKMANNMISSLDADTFPASKRMKRLDISHNLLETLPQDIFSTLSQSDALVYVNMEGNLLTSLPKLTLPALETVKVAGNRLTKISNGTFIDLSNLKGLNLSNNLIRDIESWPLFTAKQEIKWIDLSNNLLAYVDPDWFPQVKDNEHYHLKHFKISGNNLTKFELHNMPFGSDIRLRAVSVDMSHNNMETFQYRNVYGVMPQKFNKLRRLNLSNNRLKFDSSRSKFDYERRVWGPVSVFQMFPALEELKLSNNQIEVIPMDLRHNLPNLRHLDLSHNKIKVIWDQDLLFSVESAVSDREMLHAPIDSDETHRKWASDEFGYRHELIVDLRHNSIETMELSDSKIAKVPNVCGKDKLYSHATLLMADNPFLCGCQVFNLLRYKDMEIRIISEIERMNGVRSVLPAKLDIQGLQCWQPLQIRGMNVSEVELWMFHLMPLYVICMLSP